MGRALRVSLAGCLSFALVACARGVSTYDLMDNPIVGEDGAVGALPSGDGSQASNPPVPPSDGGPNQGADSGRTTPPPDASLPPIGVDAGDSGSVTQDPRPVLNDIDPASVAVNPGSAVDLTILGSAFVARSVAQADGVALATSFVSSTELSARLPASMLTSVRTIAITVFTPAPGGGTSAASRDFRVVTSVPMLSSITPTYAQVGAPAVEIVASGSGFEAGAVLVFDNTDIPAAAVTATELRAVVPATQFATGRFVLVRVKNPGNGGGTSAAQTFEVRNAPCVINSVSPAKALVNTQVTLQLTGNHLVSGSTVSLDGGPARTPTSTSGTQLVVNIPATDLKIAGALPVTVSLPAPTMPGLATCTFNLPVEFPTPTITSLSPTTIMVGAGDTLLTVTGTGFVTGSSAIRLDGAAAPNATTCTSANQCRTTLPAALLAQGKVVAVTVVNPAPGGGVSNAVDLPINNPSPVLSSLSPSFIAQGSPAQSLTLNGSGFLPTSQIWMTPKSGGASTLQSPTTQSSTRLTLNLSATFLATAESYDVSVENPLPNAGPSIARPFAVWSGSCPTVGVDLPIVGTGVIADFDLTWSTAATSTGIYGGSSSCGTTLNASVKRKFRPVVVQNNSPDAVVLSAWGKCAANDSAWLAFYKGSTIPVSDAELRMCNGKIGQGVGIYGAPASDSAGSVGCPGLMKADNAGIRLEACESVVVYMQMQTTTGGAPAKLRVRADVP